MAWNQRSCWTLLCDNCLDGWTDAGLPHFDSREAATAHATAAGWVVMSTRALCGECAEFEICAMAGHRWAARWTAVGPFPSRTGGPAWSGRVRYCSLCSAADWDPPIARSDDLGQAG